MHSVFNFHEDCQINSKNALHPRTCYVPCGSYLDAVEKPREKSDRLIDLRGEWCFAAYSDIGDVPADIAEKGVRGGSVRLPANMEMLGFGRPSFCDKYPFPCDMPYTAPENPSAVFCREFCLEEQLDGFKKYFVTEGASPFYLYINGRFAGYSQGLRRMSEFDITEHCVNGSNSICIIAVKYADSAYLECQSAIGMWGMYGNMYILARPNGHVEDFSAVTEFANCMRTAVISVNVRSPLTEGVRVTLTAPDGEAIESKTADADGNAVFSVDLPYMWSAEAPDLYTVIISAAGEYIAAKIGVRSISCGDGVFRINNRPVKLKGVIYNPISHVNGYSLTREKIHKDLIRMKKNNINAVRFTQLPSPAVLELCDSVGMYVIDDTGTNASFMPEETDPSELAVLREAYIGRTRCIYERDKNHPCVVMWSLGQNAGDGENIRACYDLIKSLDTARPVMYCSGEGFDIDAVSGSDEAEWRRLSGTRPAVVYSYSCGAKRLWDKIYSDDRIAGAFFDEWCEQAVKLPSGEVICREGEGISPKTALVPRTGRTSAALNDLKFVLEPVAVTPLDIRGGLFEVSNLNNFIYLSQLECFYEILRDGEVAESKSIGTLPIPPHRSQEVELPYFVPDSGDCSLRIIFRQAGESCFAREGHTAAMFQFKLPGSTDKISDLLAEKAPVVTEDNSVITVEGEGFCYVFGKRTGMLCSMKTAFGELLRAPAYIDAGLAEKHFTRMYGCESIAADGNIIIKPVMSLCSDGRTPYADISAEYTVNSAGDISVSFAVSTAGCVLPRLALVLPTGGEYRSAEYCGMGPVYCTADMHAGVYRSCFRTGTEEMAAEAGASSAWSLRYGTRFAAVYDGRRHGLMIKGKFTFGVSADEPAKICAAYMQGDGTVAGEAELTLLLRPITNGSTPLMRLANTEYGPYSGYQMSFRENEEEENTDI